jgi:hypothetical protein
MLENRANIQLVKNSLCEIARFPRVVGAIKGTNIKILNPVGDFDRTIFNNSCMRALLNE